MKSVYMELREALQRRHFWLLFGLHDAGSRFQRTSIGGFFYSLNILLRVAIIYLVMGATLGKNYPLYFGYVALGIPIFSLISAAVTQGYSILSRNKSIMLNMQMPIFAFVLRFLTEQSIKLGFSLATYLGFLVLNPWILNANFAYLLLGLPLLVLLVTSIAMFCMVISAFFPNIYEFLNAGMGIMFFATPVFWRVETRQGVRGLLGHYNPFSHMLAIVRDPALGEAPSWISFAVCIGLLIVISSAAVYLLRVSRPWLVYRL